MAKEGGADPAVPVVNNREARRFEAELDGRVAAVDYVLDGRTIYLTHTEVPPELRGRGVAQQLARAALDHARAEQLRVVVLCPFVTSYLKRHPEYAALVRKEW